MRIFNKIKPLLALIAAATLTACSTTSRIPEGETLYTGVKKIKYNNLDTVKIDSSVKDQIFEAVDVKPNNPLYSPYYRTPLPIGLWVYNHWNPKSKGLKGWLYKNLVAYPVLISRVRPQTRVEMINTLLKNNGYFDSSAGYKLHYNNDEKRKAKITYSIDVKAPYTLGEISYLQKNTPLTNIIDSLAQVDPYLQRGNRYCTDSLQDVRIDITNKLRDMGYYYFRPEYIEYLADSVSQKGIINLQLIESHDVPNNAKVRYLSRNVTATVWDNSMEGTPDTIVTRRCTLIKMQPVNIDDDLIPSCIRAWKGRPFRVGNMDRTQMYLSRLGIFSNIDMRVVPVDTITADGDRMLDLIITCVLDKPIEAKVEVQGTSKSNSFIGPGIDVGIAHKNLWGGGEKLSADLTASYEWQTGKGNSYKNNDLNSYEFGANVSLAIPRLLAPKFIDRSRRYVNWTRFSINGDIMNRPDYFKMAKMGGEFTWEWHANKQSLNEFTPFKLTYSKLMNTSPEFDSVMVVNPALALSFSNTFIPQMSYTYTYDNKIGPNNYTWTSTIIEAGNIFAGIWELAGNKGTKKLFGTPFSQFVKAQTQFVWTRDLSTSSQLATRVFVGAAHAYGNSEQVPFSEQFYVGGANSIRAFTVRTIGPGSSRTVGRIYKGYYDQTGTFKFEFNTEYRFGLLGSLKGALFLDAGNVWLLKEDENRPGGKLEMKNFFDEIAWGVGVGLRFDMGMLVIRGDLGIPVHVPFETSHHRYFNIDSDSDVGPTFHLAIGYPF